MKRVYVLLAALVLATGCSSNTAPAANDNRPQFVANLLPSSEVPPVTNAESTASGAAVINFNLTKDGTGAITAATVDFRVELSGFPATSTITNAHIHTGAAGVNGGVLVNAQAGSGTVTLTNGVGTFSRPGLPITAENAQAIINNPAGFYFNVHTSLNPGGVMRGQIVRQ
ncbi:MAG: CHRD domain-containing protein [Vicinamibacterales bacterium]|nr:CHRD domain-containing protein [Vicinamibacterales bacterium]